MTPRCLVCDALLTDPANRCRAWCMTCHDGVLDELLHMGDLPDVDRFVVVGMFHVHGAETCARCVTRVPFTPVAGEE